ncbi:MAG TPA: hypothetical protein VMK32_09095 [Burkholderiaceae bacterium]|nr:hypothetical protein [Burkholderiaceae bacterium]
MSSQRSNILCCSFAAVVAALCGCSTVNPSQEPRVVGESPTGSNIPRKDRSGTGVKTVDDQNTIQAPLPPVSRPPTGSGGG